MFILFQCHWSIVPMYWDQNRDSVILLFTTPTGFLSSAILPRLLSSTLQLKVVNEGTEDRVLSGGIPPESSLRVGPVHMNQHLGAGF